MDKDKTLTTTVNALFLKKTPAAFIKTRPGPGGLRLRYVEVGYVIGELNKAFGPFWEWKIVDKAVGTDQIWVQGELTVKGADGFSVTKANFGGASIKKSLATGKPVSIGNDLKAASADALKKAASLFGIAADVFYKEMDILEESEDIIDQEADGDKFARQGLQSKYFVVSAQRGFSGEDAKKLIKESYNVEHMANLSDSQLQKAVEAMELKYQKVEPGEAPLKVGEFRKVGSAQNAGSIIAAEIDEGTLATPETDPIPNEEKVSEDIPF